jgi:hypothetical protein
MKLVYAAQTMMVLVPAVAMLFGEQSYAGVILRSRSRG